MPRAKRPEAQDDVTPQKPLTLGDVIQSLSKFPIVTLRLIIMRLTDVIKQKEVQEVWRGGHNLVGDAVQGEGLRDDRGREVGLSAEEGSVPPAL